MTPPQQAAAEVLARMLAEYGDEPLKFTTEKSALSLAIAALRAAPAPDGREVAGFVLPEPDYIDAEDDPNDAARPQIRTGYYSADTLRRAHAGALATPPQPAGAVDDAMVERACEAYWPHWNLRGYYSANSKQAKRKKMQPALEAARIGGVVAGGASLMLHPPTGSQAAAPSPTPGEPKEYAKWPARFSGGNVEQPTPGACITCGKPVTDPAMFCSNPVHEPTPPVEASGREAVCVKRWPFVESPGEFADRLAQALREFPMIGAVRCVLIEEPPTLAADYLALATPSDEPKGNGNG